MFQLTIFISVRRCFFSTLCQVEAVEADHVEDLEGSHVSLECYRCKLVETTRMKRSNLTQVESTVDLK